MIKATLQTPLGEHVATFDLPTTLSEMTLAQYVDFIAKGYVKDGGNEVLAAANAVSKFAGVDIVDVLCASFGEQSLLDEGVVAGLCTINNHIAKIIADYKPEIRTTIGGIFTYQGYEYNIPAIRVSAIGGMPILPDISVLEAIECHEIQREAATQASISGDADGNLLYSMYLKLLTLLCRRGNETLPLNDAERDNWINDRMLDLKGIDAQTALDVAFFLANTIQHFGQTPAVVTFLTHRLLDLAVETIRPKGKHTQRLLRTVNRFLNDWDGGNYTSPLRKKGGLRRTA